MPKSPPRDPTGSSFRPGEPAQSKTIDMKQMKENSRAAHEAGREVASLQRQLNKIEIETSQLLGRLGRASKNQDVLLNQIERKVQRFILADQQLERTTARASKLTGLKNIHAKVPDMKEAFQAMFLGGRGAELGKSFNEAIGKHFEQISKAFPKSISLGAFGRSVGQAAQLERGFAAQTNAPLTKRIQQAQLDKAYRETKAFGSDAPLNRRIQAETKAAKSMENFGRGLNDAGRAALESEKKFDALASHWDKLNEKGTAAVGAADTVAGGSVRRTGGGGGGRGGYGPEYGMSHFTQDMLVASSLHPGRIIKHLFQRARQFGGAGAGGGGGGIGGAATAAGEGAAGAAGIGVLGSAAIPVLIAAAGAGIGYEGYKLAMSAGPSLEAMSSSARNAGMSTEALSSIYGGKKGFGNISPLFARFGTINQTDAANMQGAYGLEKGAGAASYISALASSSKYMGFQSGPEWMNTISGFQAQGYSLKSSLNAVRDTLVDTIGRGVRAGIQAPQAFQAFQTIRQAATSGGYAMPIGEMTGLTNQGFASGIPSLRSGAAQAAGIDLYQQQLKGMVGDPVMFMTAQAELMRKTGSSSPTRANVMKMVRGEGVSQKAFPFTGKFGKQFDELARQNPALAWSIITPFMNPEAAPKMQYQGLIGAGLPPALAAAHMMMRAPSTLAAVDTARSMGILSGGGGPGALGPEDAKFEALQKKGGLDYLATLPPEKRKAELKKLGLGGVEGGLIEQDVENLQLVKKRIAESNVEVEKLTLANRALQAFATQIDTVTGLLRNAAGLSLGTDPTLGVGGVASALGMGTDPTFGAGKALAHTSVGGYFADKYAVLTGHPPPTAPGTKLLGPDSVPHPTRTPKAP